MTMSRSRVIADIRRHRGDARNIIGLVVAFASAENADIDWLVSPDQARLRPPGQVIGTADQYDPSWALRIRERLLQLSQSETGGSLWVLSYDAAVRAAAENLSETKIPVMCRSLAELISEASTQRRSYKPLLSPLSDNGVLTLPEAIEIAKQALRKGGYVTREAALHQPSLRPKMTEVDSRTARIPGVPSSESLITDVVRTGLRDGWLKQFRRVEGQNGTEAVYLVEKTDISAIRPEIPADSNGLGKAQAEPEESSKPLRKKHANRSDTFLEELSKLRIGAMPETREILLNAVETALNAYKDEKPTLSMLFARAGREAQESANASGFQSEKNWPIVGKCFQRLMLRAGVILGENEKPIRDQIGSASSRVFSLAHDFRRKCEAYIAEQIIARVDGFSYDDDLYYLGLVLYRRGKERAVSAEELREKADELLSFMQGNGAIEMNEENRMIRVRSTFPENRLAAVAVR